MALESVIVRVRSVDHSVEQTHDSDLQHVVPWERFGEFNDVDEDCGAHQCFENGLSLKLNQVGNQLDSQESLLSERNE